MIAMDATESKDATERSPSEGNKENKPATARATAADGETVTEQTDAMEGVEEASEIAPSEAIPAGN
jgi:hypothetical protein